MNSFFQDPDPQETKDWLDSLQGVIEHEGAEKAEYLLSALTDRARELGVAASPGLLTPYTNTILPKDEEPIPNDSLTARNVAAYVRWNAMAMVARANKGGKSLGGHIAPTPLCRPCTRSASTGSFGGRRRHTGRISSISKGTVLRGFMPGLSSKGGSMRNTWQTSGRRWAAMAFLPILTPG